MRKIYNILLIICIIASLNIGCSDVQVSDKKLNSIEEDKIILPDGSISYSDGTMTLAEGSVAYSLLDIKNKEKIDHFGVLEPSNGILKGIITFQQNLPGEKEYLLLILVDYMQQEFRVENQIYRSFPFILEGEDKTEINFELPTPDGAKELTWLIVSEPNMKKLSIDTNEGWTDMYWTQGFCTGSYFLEDKEIENINLVYDKNAVEIKKNINLCCDLTKNINEVKIMPKCKSNDNVKLVFGNASSLDSNAILISFLNWEQIPIQDDLIKAVSIKADKNYYYDIIMPNVQYPTPYQVFIFYNPFQRKVPGVESEASMRTIIHEEYGG